MFSEVNPQSASFLFVRILRDHWLDSLAEDDRCPVPAFRCANRPISPGWHPPFSLFFPPHRSAWRRPTTAGAHLSINGVVGRLGVHEFIKAYRPLIKEPRGAILGSHVDHLTVLERRRASRAGRDNWDAALGQAAGQTGHWDIRLVPRGSE